MIEKNSEKCECACKCECCKTKSGSLLLNFMLLVIIILLAGIFYSLQGAMSVTDFNGGKCHMSKAKMAHCPYTSKTMNHKPAQ